MWRLGLVAVNVVMVFASGVTAQVIPDQEGTGGDPSVIVLIDGAGQSFTVGIAGQFVSVKLRIWNQAPPSTVVGSLYRATTSEGRPIGDPIALTELPLEHNVDRTGNIFVFDFTEDHIDVEVGDQLAIEIDSGFARRDSGVHSLRLNPYGGGEAYTRPDGLWAPQPGDDLRFQTFVIPFGKGDMNHDHYVNGLDVDPFVYAVLNEPFNLDADVNGDGAVTGLDVDPFVAVLLGEDSGTQPIPEPSTLLLCIIALGVVGITLIPCGKVAC